MNVNGISDTGNTEYSGFSFDQKDTSSTVPAVKFVLPRDTSTVDLGAPAKRYKNVYVDSLNGYAVPGSGYMPISGGAFTGDVSMGNNRLTNASQLYTFGNVNYGASGTPMYAPAFRNSMIVRGVAFTTNTETNLFDGATLWRPAMTVAAPTNPGMVLNLNTGGQITLLTAQTFTVRVKVNGTNVVAGVIAGPYTGYLPIKYFGNLQLETPTANRLQSELLLMPTQAYPLTYNGAEITAWNPTTSNTVTITGQFSGAGNSFQALCLEFGTSSFQS